MQVTLPDKPLFTPREIKELGICSDTKFYQLVADGEIVAHKFGRHTKVTRDNLLAYLARRPAIKPKRRAA